MNCLICGIELESDKAKTCSPKCRKELSRVRSVTKNVSVTSKIEPSVTFEFTVTDNRDDPNKKKVRSAIYWYDVPLAAVPKLKDGWPKMPDFMNGRQYFLWWKNEFKENNGVPEILNPFPQYEKLDYYQAGEGSRRWGA